METNWLFYTWIAPFFQSAQDRTHEHTPFYSQSNFVTYVRAMILSLLKAMVQFCGKIILQTGGWVAHVQLTPSSAALLGYGQTEREHPSSWTCYCSLPPAQQNYWAGVNCTSMSSHSACLHSSPLVCRSTRLGANSVCLRSLPIVQQNYQAGNKVCMCIPSAGICMPNLLQS